MNPSSTKKSVKTSAKSSTASGKTSKGFTVEERAATKQRAQELKAEARANQDRAEGESAVLAKIAEMQEPDRAMAKQLHAIIKASAPALSPKLWYGMPAYAKDGKVLCFFQDAQKFKTRYATLGFSDEANLDEGGMWPAAFALKKADRHRRGKDRGAREESGELRADLAAGPRPRRVRRSVRDFPRDENERHRVPNESRAARPSGDVSARNIAGNRAREPVPKFLARLARIAAWMVRLRPSFARAGLRGGLVRLGHLRDFKPGK